MGEHQQGMGGSFAGLGLFRNALCAVTALGYQEPTPVQEQVIPHVLAGRDVLVAAQTGTGKTASFLLPALQRVGNATRAKAPIVLVVVPTRELAMQVAGVANTVGNCTQHTVATAVGGVGYEAQRRALEDGCDVLVATPGRLLDLVKRGYCSLGDVELLVLDEADRMLSMGFLPDVQMIVSLVPASRQTLLFSATLETAAIKDVLYVVKDPAYIQVKPAGSVTELVNHYVLFVAAEEKKRVLVEVLRRECPKRVLVFVRGKHRADHLSRILQHKGFACEAIHGGRTQKQRMRSLERFASGKVDVVVATDVLARGIHIDCVAYVVNADVPHEVQNYVHRVGRTGRAGNKGWALTLCSPQERRDFLAIERYVGKSIPVFPRVDVANCGGSPHDRANKRDKGDSASSNQTRKQKERKKHWE